MNHDQLRDETLRLVNLARVAMGKDELDDLPLGIRSDCKHCPIANALEAYEASNFAIILNDFATPVIRAWGMAGFDVNSTNWAIVPPMPIRSFINAFDRGEFPEYETEPEYES